MPEGLEIERVFLLARAPDLPPGAVSLRIEQGYLPAPRSDRELEGRLRRIERPDGVIDFIHTIKRGSGLVREEVEHAIDRATFEREWPRTERQRLSKTRHEVREGDHIWQIDLFDQPEGLVLAEVELEGVDDEVAIPPWLAPHIIREVTEDAALTNRAIARRLGGMA